MTFVPVTRKDFIRVGIRINTLDALNESDRLLRLADDDIGVLCQRGYTRQNLEELRRLRRRLLELYARRRDLSGQKRGAREEEARTMEEGRTALRSGQAVLLAAVSRQASRPVAEEEELREKIGNLTEQTSALRGRLWKGSADLRARLETLKTIITRPDFEPDPEEAPARGAFVAEIDDIISRLTAVAELKKRLQNEYKINTAEINEYDGRVYHNLLVLTRVGRAVFRELNQHQRAALYTLKVRKDSRDRHDVKTLTQESENTASGATPAVRS